MKVRAGLLREKGRQKLATFLECENGAERQVLMETNGMGRTEQFTPVLLDGIDPGTMVTTKIIGHNGQKLIGQKMEQAPHG